MGKERIVMQDGVSLPSIGSLFSIIEALHDNVAIVSGSGTFLWVSRCFERTYNIARKNVIGRTTYELERERVFYPSVSALVLQTKRVVTLTEENQAGEYNIVTGVPIYNDGGQVAFVVSYTIDPRYSVQLHAEYEKINALLMQATAPVSLSMIPNFVSESKAMQGILSTITKLAKVDTSVLITGESGVGKNVLARHLHQISDRSAGPLIEINCAGIPDALLESELFGYEAGAFTGAKSSGKTGRIELANGGTLFLDEIGELPLSLQAKLLQVIQEKKMVKIGGTKPVTINFRLITATNQDLRALVAKKRFRSDLFFRLNVFPVVIPPLRERVEDILPLCRMILHEMNVKYDTKKSFSSELEDALYSYSWPGNVRELRNMIEQLVIMSAEAIIDVDALPEHMQGGVVHHRGAVASLHEALENLEAQIIREAYAKYDTTVAVGKALGISQPSAARKIAKYCRTPINMPQ